MLHHRYYVFMKMQCSMSFKKVSVFTCIFKGALLKGHTFLSLKTDSLLVKKDEIPLTTCIYVSLLLSFSLLQ